MLSLCEWAVAIEFIIILYLHTPHMPVCFKYTNGAVS